jgi:TetR/AcrR family transcriptional regulator, cholesterol catabolism regulator
MTQKRPTNDTTRSRGNGISRERMFDAAARIFARTGYHGTGTRALAETLGITAPSLYAHIQSKDEILEEVCIRGIKLSLGLLSRSLEQGQNTAERIRLFFTLWRGELIDHCDYSAVYLHERRYLPHDARVRVEQYSRAFRNELDRLFTNAESRGELSPSISVRNASLLTIGTIRNINQLYLEGPIREFDEFAHASVEHLIRGISKSGNEAESPT